MRIYLAFGQRHLAGCELDGRRRVGKLSDEASTNFLSMIARSCVASVVALNFSQAFIPLSNMKTELSFLVNPEQLPDDGSVVRTDETDYSTIGVVYLFKGWRAMGLRAGEDQLLEDIFQILSLELKHLGNRLFITLKVVS